MRDVLDELDRLVAGGRAGSGWPRWSAPGAARRGSPARRWSWPRDGEAVGSVSGGCVEGAVYELARRCSPTGEPVLQRYGVSDDDAFAVGLTCGGIIDIFVEPVDAGSVPRAAARSSPRSGPHEPVAVARWSTGPATLGRASGGLAGPRGRHARARSGWTTRSTDDARGMLARAPPACCTSGPTASAAGTSSACSCSPSRPPPRMLVFGAIDFAAAVARVGTFLGYRVTVCDARAGLRHAASGSRTPTRSSSSGRTATSADGQQVDERTVHLRADPRPEVRRPAAGGRAAHRAAYIGAMGSRRTHDDRLARLREAGVTEEELARLASPIGLDLGARTPEETAVSIAAEIIALRWGGTGQRLGRH